MAINSSTGFAARKIGDNEAVDKVTCEILSRLPVKSLVRFKCVCKPWRFLVENDPYFIDLHFTRSKTRPNFFAASLKQHEKALFVTGDYLSTEGNGGKATVDIHNTWEMDEPGAVLDLFGPLNGLLGFYDYENYLGVRLVNVCTRKITPWMKSSLDRTYVEQEDEIAIQYTSCQLGFDPTTKEHKVICLRSLKNQSRLTFCEVFTVGGDEWRKIDDVPFEFTIEYKHSVYLNGSIYYSSLLFMTDPLCHKYYKPIFVFDVGPEKFRSIIVPNFIIDHLLEIQRTVYESSGLLEVDGQLALSCRISSSIVKLWIYNDVDNECKRNNRWREVTIELPSPLHVDRFLTFLPGMEKNQIILKSGQYYSYNWTEKTFTKMEIRGIPYQGFLETSMCDTTFVESLLPAQ